MKVAGKQQVSTAAPGADSGEIQSENKQQEIAIGPTTTATTTTKKPTTKPPTRNSVQPLQSAAGDRTGDTPTIYAGIKDPGKAEQVMINRVTILVSNKLPLTPCTG